MFAFKARSISEYIANPLVSGATIPVDSVIFVTNQQMSNYSGSGNWSFIAGGSSPTYIRGVVNPSNAGLIYSKNIGDAVTTRSVGGHSGIEGGTFQQPRNEGSSIISYGVTNTNAGVHSHSITGLSGVSYLGGVFFAGTVVGMYKCITPTKEIPAKTIVLTSGNVLNDDYTPLNNNAALITGSSTWITTNGGALGDAISPTYGTSNPVASFINILTSSAGTHTHELSNVFPLYSRYQYTPQVRTPDELSMPRGNHNHYAAVDAIIYPAIIYQTAHQTKKTTGVYRGTILGWVGTNPATLPTGWYLCNGQTVNGFATPSLNVNRFIMTTNNTNDNGVQGGNDTADIYISTSAGTTSSTHSHYPGGDDYRTRDTTYSAYHQTHDWVHNHDTITPASISYRPSYITMNFIIYLG
jgi:hypothetical protein